MNLKRCTSALCQQNLNNNSEIISEIFQRYSEVIWKGLP